MLGPRGVAFDNDDALEDNDDEDLKNDPVSTMDMRVRPNSCHVDVLFWMLTRCDLQAHLLSFLRECAARNTNNFSAVVEQLSPEETVVIRKVVSEQ